MLIKRTSGFFMDFSNLFVLLLLLLLPNVAVCKPLTKDEPQSMNWLTESMNAARNETRPSGVNQSQPKLAFIRLETLSGRTSMPTDESIVIKGDSSLRLFRETDINHPSFDPSSFLKLATNDSVQAVEVSPVSNQPYFMFIPPALLKNDTFRAALFGTSTKRRVKRHHPTMLQNVLGELQNYALVPIKSTNGQIRYILLKNPKFVIGNPASSTSKGGQTPPTIVQLNSNNVPAGLSGQRVQYNPLPTEKATAPPFRRAFRSRPPPAVPMAKSIDSSFNTRNVESDRSSTNSVKTTKSQTFTRTSVSATQPRTRTIPNIPLTWKELKRNIGSRTSPIPLLTKQRIQKAKPITQGNAGLSTAALGINEPLFNTLSRANAKISSPVFDPKTNKPVLTRVLEATAQVASQTLGTEKPAISQAVEANANILSQVLDTNRNQKLNPVIKTDTQLYNSLMDTNNQNFNPALPPESQISMINTNNPIFNPAIQTKGNLAMPMMGKSEPVSKSRLQNDIPISNGQLNVDMTLPTFVLEQNPMSLSDPNFLNSNNFVNLGINADQTIITGMLNPGKPGLNPALPPDVQLLSSVAETNKPMLNTQLQARAEVITPMIDASNIISNSGLPLDQQVLSPQLGTINPAVDLTLTSDTQVLNPMSDAIKPVLGPLLETDPKVLSPALGTQDPSLDLTLQTGQQVLVPLVDTVKLSIDPVLPTDPVVLTQGLKTNTDISNPVVNSNAEVLTPASDVKKQVFTSASKTPVSETKKVSVRTKSNSKSVANDKIESSAGSMKEDANGITGAVANATLTKTGENITHVDQTNSKNITITKIGDQHMIEQTEIVETIVDVVNNETAVKTDSAASRVTETSHDSGNHHHHHGGTAASDHSHSHHGPENANEVHAKSGASEKATAEKQAHVVKKTKKTTTILLKSGSETKSGKAEISEIQHTVEELVHHNTSETAAAETAAASNVDMTHSESHGSHHGHSGGGGGHDHSHGSHSHIDSEKSGAAEAKKETNSASRSVKTKSVKQTLIKKNIPDPNASNSTVSETGSGAAAAKPKGGFDVEHVEHVVHETEHKTSGTSEKSKQKAMSSNSHEVHNHPHHHHH